MAEPANVWEGVKPLSPTDAELNVGFLFLDAAKDENPDYQAYADRLNMIINGVYLAGWQDASRHLYSTCLVFEAGEE